jgi:hypothetical protein
MASKKAKAKGKRQRKSGKGVNKVPAAARRAVNEAAVRQFFGASDPAWRWVLILGLRDLRANATRLGELAALEAGNDTWSADTYVYGPLVHGLTAAAVNECAQHCEDLFAVLKFMREDLDFAKRMSSYGAGAVTKFGCDLAKLSDEEIAALFLVPPESTVRDGLAKAEDPAASFAVFESAVEKLAGRVRAIVDWYTIYEDFHVQYKHGLKLAARPYGDPSEETIKERRQSVKGPLLAFTTDPIAKMVAGPQQQQGVIFPNLIPEAREHLTALVNDRAILRYKMSGPEVDLDEVVATSRGVLKLLKVAATNRIAMSDGLDEHSQIRFDLPGDSQEETISILLELDAAPKLDDFPK